MWRRASVNERRVAVLPALRVAAALPFAGEPVGRDRRGATDRCRRKADHGHAAAAASAPGGVEDGDPLRRAGGGRRVGADAGFAAGGCAVAAAISVDSVRFADRAWVVPEAAPDGVDGCPR